MEGCWTIWRFRDNEGYFGRWEVDGVPPDYKPPERLESVPVVPCDDAAIERVADVIEMFMDTPYVWSTREFAEAVLASAAGQAPAFPPQTS